MPKIIMYTAIGTVALLIVVALTLLVMGSYSSEPELEPEISESADIMTISYKRHVAVMLIMMPCKIPWKVLHQQSYQKKLCFLELVKLSVKNI